MDEFEGSPKTWPPLGMPTGSVRAILTLILVAVVITRIVRGGDLTLDPAHDDLLWIEALLIALSHYFTSRRFVDLPPNARRQLEDDGILDRERNPLFLPRNSIRVIIIAAFGWLAYYLYEHNRLLEHHAATLLAMMASFLLGATVRRIGIWLNRNQVKRSQGTFGDLKALVVLAAMLCVAIPEFLGSPDVLHPVFHRVALGMMLFYFGSR
ncbi:hypothetical protein [Schlesneria paludicola]|uniref:hypothetical protein n=1 Tax=Schlesneria paludicola TaxID=360056 RepID=UPI00029AB0F1|nr:hypothetical protein [Schlesneria paludicola]